MPETGPKEWAKEIAHLQELLEIHQRNLKKWEVTKAKYGPLTPLHVLTGIEEEEAEIARLQKEIAAIRQKFREREMEPGETPPPPKDPATPHTYTLERNWLGRAEELADLTRLLTEENHSLIALHALGGMGKSSLAWVLMHKLHERGEQFAGMFWWSFYQDSTFESFLGQALPYVFEEGYNPAEVPSARAKADLLLKVLAKRPYLLILDGFERMLQAYREGVDTQIVAQREATPEQRRCVSLDVGRFLKGCCNPHLRGRILMTTRLLPHDLEDRAGQCFAGFYDYKLEGLNEKDALKFMAEQGVVGLRGDIRRVCEAYDYHPLSLRLVSSYLARYYDGDISEAPRVDVAAEDKPARILAAIDKRLDEPARQFMRLFSCWRTPMPQEALTIFADDPRPSASRGVLKVLNLFRPSAPKPDSDDLKFRKWLGELERQGLFTHEGGAYRTHPLIRGYFYEQMPAEEKKAAHLKIRAYLQEIVDRHLPEGYQDWSMNRRQRFWLDNVTALSELDRPIELYHHTVRAGLFDEAYDFFYERLAAPLYYRFGAYQTRIELLGELFPQGEGRPPRLKDEGDQAWTLNSLANSYSLSGQSRRAVPLFETLVKMHERGVEEPGPYTVEEWKRDLAIGLGNLATQQILLGELAMAEESLRRMVELCREIGDEFWEAVGHQELGRLLAYRGEFGDSERELALSTKYWKETGDDQGVCLDEAYRALRALLLGDPAAALEVARRARELADVKRWERDIIRVEWLLGAARRAGGELEEAEKHLHEALTRCRTISMVDYEPDILLEIARLRYAQSEQQELLAEAHELAQEALDIAERCEYRLKQADIHNFLARLALEAGDFEGAQSHAERAKELALCDGPPHCYKPALEEAERLLADTDSGHE